MHWIFQQPALWWGFSFLLGHLDWLVKAATWCLKQVARYFTRSFTITSKNSHFYLYQEALTRLVPDATRVREVDTQTPGSSWRSSDQPVETSVVPDYGTYRFKWRGVWVQVTAYETPGGPKDVVSKESNPGLDLTFLSRDKEVVSDFREYVMSIDLDKRKQLTTIWTNRWGGWVPYSRRRPRPVATLFYSGDVPQRMLRDLQAWMGALGDYAAQGQVHKRGYLLQGPPGNGKTTLVMWLAAQVGMDVALLSCRVDDTKFLDLVSCLPRHTILILEDVDALFESVKTRTVPAPLRESTVRFLTVESAPGAQAAQEAQAVSLSLLLNFLDGMLSRDGQVVVLTTNFPEKLDVALVRKGRADQTYTLGNATPEVFERMYAYFYGIAAPDSILDAFTALDKKPSVADLEGFLKDTPVEDAEKLLDRARTVAATPVEE